MTFIENYKHTVLASDNEVEEYIRQLDLSDKMTKEQKILIFGNIKAFWIWLKGTKRQENE